MQSTPRQMQSKVTPAVPRGQDFKLKGDPPHWQRQLFLEPLIHGWKREVVIRSKPTKTRKADVYYFAPDGSKFRSGREIDEYLEKNHITKYSPVTNFWFNGKILGGEFAPYETVRNSYEPSKVKVSRSSKTQTASPPLSDEGELPTATSIEKEESAILGGLQAHTLKPLVEQAMPTLNELMYDSSVVVRDTAAGTFGRICEIVPEAATNETYLNLPLTYLKPLLESLINGLKAEPRVAANVCWTFTGIAKASYEQAVTDGIQPETYLLSPYFEFIVHKLLETTDRVDGAQANLRSAAYKALMELVKNSPKDCYVTVQKTTMVILERLNQVLAMEQQIQSHSDRAQFNDLQGLLWATLQSVLRKMTPEDAPQISDPIMNALLQMFSSNSCKSGSVQEAAIMAVSTLVEVLGEGFIKYMPAFKPYLCMGLKNHAAYQVCCAFVELTGDICIALKNKALPYCDEIMTLLLENLSDQTVHRSVKPEILSVIGWIALSIGPEFKKYLDVVITTVMQASQIRVEQIDYDISDWLNELREGIIEVYSGIIRSLRGDDRNSPSPDLALLEPHIPYIVQFITVIASDSSKQDANIVMCAGLIGDLCSAFGPKVTMLDTEQSVLRKMTPEDAPQISDPIMNALLQMFSSNSCKSGSVQEAAIMAVSTLVEVLGEGFIKYMPAFKPYLCMGLKNHAAYQVCCAFVELTGDICIALKNKALPYCDEIMTLLLENLSDQTVHRSVKPEILSVIGCIALSIGPEFKKYLDVVITTVMQASQIRVEQIDYDISDWLNELREGIIEVYSGIIRSLRGDDRNSPSPDLALLEPHIPYIVQFITVIASDSSKQDANIVMCAGLIGDLCSAFGPKVTMLDTEPVRGLLNLGRRSTVTKTKNVSIWATTMLRKSKTETSWYLWFDFYLRNRIWSLSSSDVHALYNGG